MNLAIPLTNFFQDIAGTHSTTIANKHIIYNLTAVSKYLLRYIAQCPVSYCLALLADGTYLFKNGPIVNSTKEFGTAREVLMKM